MFDTIAEMLRGSKPDDLANVLGTDRTQTRRAMEIGLPALIVGFRDKTLEPGGLEELNGLVDSQSQTIPADISQYLAQGQPGNGVKILDTAFGERGAPTLASLSDASKLSTKLLAQVMSVLAPLASSVLRSKRSADPNELADYLARSVQSLEEKGFGRVIELVADKNLPAVAPRLELVREAPTEQNVDTTKSDGAVVGAVGVVSSQESDTTTQSDVDNLVEGLFPTSNTSEQDNTVSEDADVALTPIGSDTETPAGVVVPPVGVSSVPPVGQSPQDVDFGSSADVETSHSPWSKEREASFDPVLEGSKDTSDSGVTVASTPVTPMQVESTTDVGFGSQSGDIALDPLDEGPREHDFGGKGGLSRSGAIWWIAAAVLLAAMFGLWKCSGSEETADTTTTEPAGQTVVAEQPTVDPVQAQNQTTLDAITVLYPNVEGKVNVDVATLTGTVDSDLQNYELDNAVRQAGLKVQNLVDVVPPAEPVREGYLLTEIIQVQPQLSEFNTLLNEAGLGEALTSGSPYTVFAPTNDALAAMGEELGAIRSDQEQLRAFLQNHIVAGTHNTQTLAGLAEIGALSGDNISISTQGEAIILNNTVGLLVGDAQANNGLMHIINGPLHTVTVEVPSEIGAELGLAPITFASGKATLTDEGKFELDRVAVYLDQNPFNVEIQGHTDSDGDATYNQELSQQRADAVKAHLVAKGIGAERLNAVGFGESQPIVENDTAANKAKNRRIEFVPVN